MLERRHPNANRKTPPHLLRQLQHLLGYVLCGDGAANQEMEGDETVSELKFTPGPWRADIRVGCAAVYPASESVNCIGDIKKRLAYFKGYKTTGKDGCYEWNVSPEDAANAHLIAAAPELLEAAISVLGDIEGLIHESTGVCGLHLNGEIAPWSELLAGGRFEDWLGSLETLREAIAKATGKEA